MNKDQNASSKSKSSRVSKSPRRREFSRENEAQVDFEKAQGSSRHDQADLRDVAREAAKKSQRLPQQR
jgi:hypothetical protein